MRRRPGLPLLEGGAGRSDSAILVGPHRGHLARNEIPFSLLRLALRRHYIDDDTGMWARPGSYERQAGVNGYDSPRVRAALREYLTLVAAG